MTDRVPGAPGQYRATVTAEEFLKLQNGEAFTITMTRDDHPITEGTPYSKAAVLPDTLAAKICPSVTDPKPADALAALLPRNGSQSMTGNLPMGGNRITDLGTPVAGMDGVNLNYAKSVGAPANFLDNSDFNQIVNQRGDSSYTGKGYGIDRWFSWGTELTATVTSYTNTTTNTKTGLLRLDNAKTDGVSVFSQLIEPGKSAYMRGKKFTFAVCKLDGTIHVCSGECSAADVTSNTRQFYALGSDGLFSIDVFKNAAEQNFEVRINVAASSNVSFRWAALYEGEYTAETLPAYQPKGYAAELLECQRYYLHGSKTTFLPGYKSNTAYAFLELPVPMRIVPTVIAGTVYVRGSKDSDGANTEATGIVALNLCGNTLTFRIEGDGKQKTQIITAQVRQLILDANL